MELQSPGGLLFLLLHRQADGIQDQTYGLRFCRFISCDAVIIKVPDHGQIEDTLAGVNVRDICDPFGVRSVCMEIPVEQVFISMDLLSHIDPLLRQVCLTDGQSHNNRFWTHQMPYT